MTERTDNTSSTYFLVQPTTRCFSNARLLGLTTPLYRFAGNVATSPGERLHTETVNRVYKMEASHIILCFIKKLNLPAAAHALQIEVQRVSEVTA
jgi:hypothetical protein